MVPDDEYLKGLGDQRKTERVRKFFLTALTVLIVTYQVCLAQELAWHGFIQANYSLRTTGLSPGTDKSDFLWADHRFQLKLSASEGAARAFAKVDLFQNALKREDDLEIREAFLDYSAGKLDIRAGRQIITWGLGDLLFINDLFPKDWQAFFSGRPVEYLKIGVDGLKMTLYTSIFSLELAVLPFFEPDNLPSAEESFLFDPLADAGYRLENRPDFEFENMEQAWRLFQNISGFELALYAYRGFYRSPSAKLASFPPDTVIYYYPKLSVLGSSLQKNIYNGILSLEYGYYDSRQDRSGENPLMPNSFHKFLVGYQRQGWEDFSYSFQFYGEYMTAFSEYEKSLPSGFPKGDHFRQLLTARATQLLKYQTWKLSLFSFFSPSDNDYYLIPEVQYKFSDRLWLAVGGNLFGGEKKTTFFGQFDKNDNLYSILRYDF